MGVPSTSRVVAEPELLAGALELIEASSTGPKVKLWEGDAVAVGVSVGVGVKVAVLVVVLLAVGVEVAVGDEVGVVGNEVFVAVGE